MIRIYLSAAAAVMIAVAAGCGGGSPSGPSPEDPVYLPLAEGNYWDYDLEVTIADTFGTSITMTGSFSRDILQTVDHLQGFQLFPVEQTTEILAGDTVLSIIDTIYVRETENDVRIYQSTVSTAYELFLLLPLEVGASWPADSEKDVEVLSLSSTVTTPAGDFSGCAHLEVSYANEPDRLENIYLAPGTGMVRHTMHDETEMYIEDVVFDLDDFSVQ